MGRSADLGLVGQMTAHLHAGGKGGEFLQAAAALARAAGAGRATHCKSGKDRTAMSITLEQVGRHTLQPVPLSARLS
jgi:hypothetical protein